MHKDIKIITILAKLEDYRIRLEKGEATAGCTDHVIRMCEAIVAQYGPYSNRNQWVAELREYGYLNGVNIEEVINHE